MKTIVVGSGMAGIIAGLRAYSHGSDVVMISQGRSATSLSSGVVDVFGYFRGEEIKSPLEGIKRLEEENEVHPYAILGAERIKESIDFFINISKKVGFPFRGSIDRNIHIATQFGTVKSTCLAYDRIYSGRVERWKDRRVDITGKSERNFRPAFVVESLRILLPKLGFNAGVFHDGEYIKSLGIRHIKDRILKADIEKGEIKTLTGKRQYTGDNFIIASGDYIGGGLNSFGESIIHLDIYRIKDKPVRKIPFPVKGHPYSKNGVIVDENLNPFYREKRISNLRIAGSLLGGYDYCTEKSGLGVAIATGYSAGDME